jgi:dipeptidase E
MRLLLISSSNVHGYGFLDHAEPYIREFLGGPRKIAFVPFALFDRAGYTQRVRERLAPLGCAVTQVESGKEVETAEVLFVGGGNTFRLLKTFYELDLMPLIRERVRRGMLYIGSSAGTIITCPTIRTTNDMPIVEPPSLTSLGLVHYQINPHYVDADPNSTHKGETREERLLQFHEENATPVVGLREGTMLRVTDGSTTLVGDKPARVFRRGQVPVEVDAGSCLDDYVRIA